MPQKRDEPIKISSATLEVRDKSKMATFKGDVMLFRAKPTCAATSCGVLRRRKRRAGYESDAGSGAEGAAPVAGQGGQQIRRMEARGSVVVTQKDQRAVGDRAEFDMRTNTVTLIGNVVITSADNVARGERMTSI